MSVSLSSLYGEVQKLKKAKSVQQAMEVMQADGKYRLIDSLFVGGADSGYLKHVELMGKGADYRSRLFIAANRVGKTVMGAYETALHLTGDYPAWWDGVRFEGPTLCWASGDTSKTTREFVQLALLGHEKGTGTIPLQALLRTTAKSGTADAIDTIEVKHASGGVSRCVLKSYDQDIDAFMGGAVNFIWLDEEPPLKIYTESLIRTMTTGGRVLMTFTPVRGLSETVQHFMPSGSVPDPMPQECYVTQATWDDAPHLTDEMKRELYSALPPHQRDARSKGIPALGAGAIYPVPESEITCAPFAIPDYWPRAYGLDVGWNRTAAIWGAKDPDTGTIYLYAEYYRGEAEPSVHASGIRAPGDWIMGVIDPAARGRGQIDGRQLLQDYLDLGLDLDVARNTVEAGIYQVWELLSSGRLKVFSTCLNWINEYRVYRRDEKGRVVKERDHLMDATRYLIMSGMERAKAKPVSGKREQLPYRGSLGWM
jgi:phage terminase large subunit-like protein